MTYWIETETMKEKGIDKDDIRTKKRALALVSRYLKEGKIVSIGRW